MSPVTCEIAVATPATGSPADPIDRSLLTIVDIDDVPFSQAVMVLALASCDARQHLARARFAVRCTACLTGTSTAELLRLASAWQVSTPGQRSGIQAELLASEPVVGPSEQLGVVAAVGIRPRLDRQVLRRRRAEVPGEGRQPPPERDRLVVADVERSRQVGFDRDDRRRDGVVDVHERPATGAGPSTGYPPARSCVATSPSGWNQVPGP